MSNSTMPSTTPVGYIVLYDDITWFGISLAIVSNAFISTSLNVQKWAHNKNEALGEHRKPYTKLPVWWFGTAMNAIGELGNLVAYGYAESTVVAPIGAVGVLCSALIATFALREPFRKTDIVGILCIIAGVVLIVWAKGTEAVIEPTVEEAIQDYFIKSIIYTVLSLGATAAIYKYRHVYGEKYAIVYTMLCSLIAQWTVLGCKTFMAFVRLSVEKGNNQFCCGVTAVVPWVMFLVIVVCAVWSLHYLQMAMRYHNNNKVIPTYYATFTLCCIVGAAVVYREFEGASAASILTFFLGCFVAGVGVFTVSKDREKEAPTFPGATDLRMIEDMFDDDSTRRTTDVAQPNAGKKNSSVCASEGGADDSPRQSEHDSIAPALGDSEIHAESPASRVQGGLLDVQEGVKDLQGPGGGTGGSRPLGGDRMAGREGDLLADV